MALAWSRLPAWARQGWLTHYNYSQMGPGLPLQRAWTSHLPHTNHPHGPPVTLKLAFHHWPASFRFPHQHIYFLQLYGHHLSTLTIQLPTKIMPVILINWLFDLLSSLELQLMLRSMLNVLWNISHPYTLILFNQRKNEVTVFIILIRSINF